MFQIANYVEAGLWGAIAVIFLFVGLRAGTRRRGLSFAAAVAFAAFGASDIVEARTGAWWRPWWLPVWKALCVAALLAIAFCYRRSLRLGP